MSHPYPSDAPEMDNLMLVAGGSTPALTGAICRHLNLAPGRLTVDTFADGEAQVEFRDNIRGHDLYIVQSISPPASASLMELALIADAARRSSAESITAVAPYLGYSRQDRRPGGGRTPISARVVADILSAVGVERLVTIDLHAEQIQGFYSFPVENIYASPVLLSDLSRAIHKGGRGKDGKAPAVLVSPDIGGVARARALATQINADLAIIDKRRPKANVAEVMNTIGDVEGRQCFLIDDIADTAGTLCGAARALLDAGASSVAAYCSHPLLSGKALANIEESPLLELVCTDTVPLSEEARKCNKIRVLSVAELLAEAISRIHGKQSISSLFMD